MAEDPLAGFREELNTGTRDKHWWLCHRGVLADYLAFHGHEVTHLGRRTWLHQHYLTGRLERYDRRVIQMWEDRANR